jgi:hypothetical protein
MSGNLSYQGLRELGSSSSAYDANLDDSNDLTHGTCRGVYVGVSGHVKMTMSDGTIVTRKNVAAGFTHPWQVKRIWATGTAATDIVVDY